MFFFKDLEVEISSSDATLGFDDEEGDISYGIFSILIHVFDFSFEFKFWD